MTIYHLAIVEHKYAKTVQRILDADIDKLKDFFLHSTAFEHKEDAPLFSPWLYDAPERRAESVSGTNLIVLDYDGGYSMEYMLEWFEKNNITAFAYATFSNSPTSARYRIAIPLEYFISKKDMREQKKNILRHFPQVGLDPSSLDIARCFYVPSYNKTILQYPQFWAVEARNFNPRKLFKPIVHQNYQGESPPISVDEQRAAVFCLARCKSLAAHLSEPLWFNVACAMFSNGFSLEDFDYVSRATRFSPAAAEWRNVEDEAAHRSIQDKWMKALKQKDHTSYGVIINLIQKDGQYDWYLKMRDYKVR